MGAEGEVLAAPDHVCDAHQMVVDDVGKVVGGQAIGFDKHLVVQGVVVHGDVAEHSVGEGGGSTGGNLLADDMRHAGSHTGPGLIQAQGAAGIGGTLKAAVVLLTLVFFAEAVVGVAPLHQQLGVFAIGVPALGLNIGSHGAANIRALVPGQAALPEGLVDDLGGALHQALLVGVLNAQDKGAVLVPGDEPGVEGGAQVSNVHIAGWGRGRSGCGPCPLGCGPPCRQTISYPW